ncbi:MAG: hypothetical protein HYT13_02275 [Candidatus Liptonbacteria bacterium]|nr:hypothetical protein [Candidatus Liptonbacteria bacterium]
MVIRRTKDFADAFRKLPREVQRIFHKQEKIFRESWLDSRLHVKRLKDLPGAYSFRVTRRYRVLFYFDRDNTVFFVIGHRKDIYE